MFITKPVNLVKQHPNLISPKIFMIFVIIASEKILCDENIIGPGQYIVERIYSCENGDKYPLQMNIYKHKLNRTHDVYDVNMDMTEVLDDKLALLIEAFKLVDGGYKPYYTLQHKSACTLINKYAQENFERLLYMAGVEPPVCPVQKGKYNVTNYVFDNSELPDDGVFGEYKVKCTVKSLLNEELACLMLNINFLEDE